MQRQQPKVSKIYCFLKIAIQGSVYDLEKEVERHYQWKIYPISVRNLTSLIIVQL